MNSLKIDHIPNDTAGGIYDRVNFPDGRFLAIQPLYFGARIIMGYTRKSNEMPRLVFQLGKEDPVIARFYNLFYDLLLGGLPFKRIPQTRAKPAYQDLQWATLLTQTWQQTPSGFETGPTTPFQDMFRQTVIPIIRKGRQSI